jgi:hypothetical protein
MSGCHGHVSTRRVAASGHASPSIVTEVTATSQVRSPCGLSGSGEADYRRTAAPEGARDILCHARHIPSYVVTPGWCLHLCTIVVLTLRGADEPGRHGGRNHSAACYILRVVSRTRVDRAAAALAYAANQVIDHRPAACGCHSRSRSWRSRATAPTRHGRARRLSCRRRSPRLQPCSTGRWSVRRRWP